MTIHPREEIVRKTESDLRDALSRIINEHELTEAEELHVVAAVFGDRLASMAKYAIRAERHPRTPNPPMTITDLTGFEDLTPEELANVLASYEMLRPKLFDGEKKPVPSTKGDREYVVLRRGATLSCSCIAWKMQTIPPAFRTCKHLGRLLGCSEEQERVQAAAKAAGRRLPASPYPNRRRGR